MNLQTYIESGILEMYELNQLALNEREEVERMVSIFPEIKQELNNIQKALEMYATSQAIQPHPRVKEKIKNSILNLEKEKEMDPQDLPLITNFSDHTRWLDLVKDMIPRELNIDEPFINVLQQSGKATQMLVVAASDVPDEVHENVYESFLILKGRCKCTIGNDVRFMDAGDFMEIPLHEHHEVEILSDNVVAILQHIPVLA